MYKKIRTILFIVIYFIMFFQKINIFADTNNRRIKVGLYLYEPYYKDKNNNITGYYHDLLYHIRQYTLL